MTDQKLQQAITLLNEINTIKTIIDKISPDCSQLRISCSDSDGFYPYAVSDPDTAVAIINALSVRLSLLTTQFEAL